MNKLQEISQAKGRPLLYWSGKKPLSKIDYFPAQEKEVYGNKKAKWFNQLFWGDNLQVLAHLLKEHRGKVDLIYIDPPFDSKADYVKKVKIKGKTIKGQQQNLFEEKQYTDMWDKDEYLQFMYNRLLIMRELLSETGSIYLHCDWHKNSYLRLVMDEIFGNGNFVREIIWNRGNASGGKAGAQNWIHTHDTILFYAKDKVKQKFNKQYEEYSKEYIEERFIHEDKKGLYRLQGSDNRRQYLSESKGKAMTSVWDLPDLNVMALEKSGYPTQKREYLIERILKASSDEGDLVLDCFVGSGTTCVVAEKLNRKWIGCDINIGAIQTTTKRLNSIGKEENGFKIYNVNDYDIFKNEIEAKEIIMEMYGVEPIKKTFFDGTLDNNFVKVMSMNRVLNKLDIKNIIKNVGNKIDAFTPKKTSKKSEETFEEGVLVICSGMELDVIDFLKKENITGVKIEVRDILIDKQNLVFKKKPEAKIDIKKKAGKFLVTIKEFYSPILIRKLEIENEKILKKEDKIKVDNFKQIIDSVAIDVDYDGKLFNADIIDIPNKKEVINAEYELEYNKKNSYNVAVKIVDVLGEEYFEVIKVK